MNSNIDRLKAANAAQGRQMSEVAEPAPTTSAGTSIQFTSVMLPPEEWDLFVKLMAEAMPKLEDVSTVMRRSARQWTLDSKEMLQDYTRTVANWHTQNERQIDHWGKQIEQEQRILQSRQDVMHQTMQNVVRKVLLMMGAGIVVTGVLVWGLSIWLQ